MKIFDLREYYSSVQEEIIEHYVEVLVDESLIDVVRQLSELKLFIEIIKVPEIVVPEEDQPAARLVFDDLVGNELHPILVPTCRAIPYVIGQ